MSVEPAMGQPKVLAVGNTVLDVIGKTPEALPRFGELAAGRGPASIDIGGNGARAAVEASVLGASSSLASAIGDDVWGEWLAEQLKRLGVDTAQLETIPGEPTATTLSLVRPDGERAMLTHNGASDHHDLSSVDVSALEDGSWLLIGSLFLIGTYSGDALRTLADGARSRGAKVVMDLAWDCSGEWDIKRVIPEVADVVTGNELEVKAIGCTMDLDVAIERAFEKGVENLVVKGGPKGATVMTKGMSEPVHIPAFEVEPVNATGSGDIFNAAMVYALGDGMDLVDAVTFACAAGALRVAGGCLTFPREDEIRALMEKGT
jgi:sugar/nucleoside kinase (ribokinase family)